MSNAPINIVSVAPVGDYSLEIVFDDKTVQTVDFAPFLKRSKHPDVRAYLQPARFAAFHVEYGDLVWGDYDLCFPVIGMRVLIPLSSRQNIEPRTVAASLAARE